MRYRIKRILERMINVQPTSGMTAENLYAYLDSLYQKRNIEGEIVEVGCLWGGTTALACQFLKKLSLEKKYYCIDTFSGFLEEQFEEDKKLGLPEFTRNRFQINSLNNVQSNLKRWNVDYDVTLIQGDICKLSVNLLPEKISVCLLDVDLKVPIYEGLKKVWARLSEGGIVLIDDCKPGTAFVGANEGYLEFMREHNFPAKYFLGMAILEKAGHTLNWKFRKTL